MERPCSHESGHDLGERPNMSMERREAGNVNVWSMARARSAQPCVASFIRIRDGTVMTRKHFRKSRITKECRRAFPISAKGGLHEGIDAASHILDQPLRSFHKRRTKGRRHQQPEKIRLKHPSERPQKRPFPRGKPGNHGHLAEPGLQPQRRRLRPPLPAFS